MKKLLILLIAPLLMATQCDEDDDPLNATEYFITNNSSISLTYLTPDANEILIESGSSQFIAIASHDSNNVLPSQSIAFDSVTLFKRNNENMLTTAYEQNPINDQLWELQELSSFSFEYYLEITDDLLE